MHYLADERASRLEWRAPVRAGQQWAPGRLRVRAQRAPRHANGPMLRRMRVLPKEKETKGW